MTQRPLQSATDFNSGRYQLSGFSEAGVCTHETENWRGLLTGFGQWQEIWCGETPIPIRQLWGLDPSAQCFEYLLGNPGSHTGLIRLFQISGVTQCEIRPNSSAWDSGGIFDLDIRVRSMQSHVSGLEQCGWQGISQPIDWQFGKLQVREWLTRGPESAVLALIERLAPPLEGWDEWHGFSQVFNSSQIVANMDSAVSFYLKLGFVTHVEHHGPLNGRGGEVLGLKPWQAPRVPIRLVIMQPRGAMYGSIELVSFEDAGEDFRGKDLAARANPINLGLNLLRFPVDDLEKYANDLNRREIKPQEPGIIGTDLPPHGRCKLMAIQSPDGAWLEFYQSESCRS